MLFTDYEVPGLPYCFHNSSLLLLFRLHFPDGPIGRVPAFDPDETDRANLRYSVKSGNANQANFFTLNATTGFITLNNNLDSDRMNEGEFVVQVTGTPLRQVMLYINAFLFKKQ